MTPHANEVPDMLAKIERLKAAGTVDLSADEDLSLAVMNLVSLEEHFFFTAMRTGRGRYLDLLDEARELRKSLLGRLVDQHEGETWCAAKHLLATSMRLIEVGTKLRAQDKPAAKEMFEHAYRVYAMFWALRLDLAGAPAAPAAKGSDRPWTAQDIVAKLVNCCDE